MIKRVVIILMPLIALVLIATPAYALEPPDDISIDSIQVIRNTAEDGDIAFLFYFDTDYVSYPESPSADDSVILRLLDTDGITLIATGSPYSLFDHGYGPQVSSFYFDADTVSSLGLTWGEQYTISITFSEAYITSPPVENYMIAANDYSDTTDQDENQVILASWVLEVCDDLHEARADYLLYILTDSGVVLTTIGELYFRGAIPGLQSMSPDLFYFQYTTPEVTEIEYTANMTAVYGGRLDDTDVMTGFDRIGDQLGISGGFVIALFFVIIAIAILIFTTYKGWGPEPGLLMGGNWLTLGALLAGNTVMVLRIVIAFIAGIMLLYVMLFRRA